jgi:carbonic anhydrase
MSDSTEPTSSADSAYDRLLRGNRVFAEEMTLDRPDFFRLQALKQTPSLFWIGCSDSRVASDLITRSQPGEQFVHRNIANMVVHTDMNLLSSLDFAVKHLKVAHVIVCGHYECGGILAAMSNTSLGLIDHWLRNVKDVYRLHHAELEAITDPKERARRLVELNVREQVYNVCQTFTIQQAWKLNSGSPQVHGWVYDLDTGLIKELDIETQGGSDISGVYKFDAKSLMAEHGSE